MIAQLIAKIAQKADAAQNRDTPAPAPRPTPIEEMRLRLRNLMQEEARRAANDHPLPNNGELAQTL